MSAELSSPHCMDSPARTSRNDPVHAETDSIGLFHSEESKSKTQENNNNNNNETRNNKKQRFLLVWEEDLVDRSRSKRCRTFFFLKTRNETISIRNKRRIKTNLGTKLCQVSHVTNTHRESTISGGKRSLAKIREEQVCLPLKVREKERERERFAGTTSSFEAQTSNDCMADDVGGRNK